MSDTEKSGAALDEPTATTPAAQSGDKCTTEQALQPAAQQPQSDFAFGTSRGSGLARGKRKTVTAPDAPAQANSNGYQPTAIEVITNKSEYSNPFTGETVVETPRREEPAKVETARAEEPALNPVQPDEEKGSKSESPTAPEESEGAPTAEAEKVSKPELKILPPAQPNRSRQSWESPSEHPARRAAAATADSEKTNNDSAAEVPRSRSPRGSSEGRPTFQPERRSHSPRNVESDVRPDRSAKPHREERPKREPKDSRDQPRTERTPRSSGTPAKPTAKPQGFFGWLKSLFGGGDKPSSSRPKSAHGHSNEQRHEGGPRRRSRGGRSNSNGPRNGSESYGSRRSGEKTVGERPSSNRNSEEQRDRPRNRSRGGRGGRGRNGPRSEGQQSGGAI